MVKSIAQILLVTALCCSTGPALAERGQRGASDGQASIIFTVPPIISLVSHEGVHQRARVELEHGQSDTQIHLRVATLNGAQITPQSIDPRLIVASPGAQPVWSFELFQAQPGLNTISIRASINGSEVQRSSDFIVDNEPPQITYLNGAVSVRDNYGLSRFTVAELLPSKEISQSTVELSTSNHQATVSDDKLYKISVEDLAGNRSVSYLNGASEAVFSSVRIATLLREGGGSEAEFQEHYARYLGIIEDRLAGTDFMGSSTSCAPIRLNLVYFVPTVTSTWIQQEGERRLTEMQSHIVTPALAHFFALLANGGFLAQADALANSLVVTRNVIEDVNNYLLFVRQSVGQNYDFRSACNIGEDGNSVFFRMLARDAGLEGNGDVPVIFVDGSVGPHPWEGLARPHEGNIMMYPWRNVSFGNGPLQIYAEAKTVFLHEFLHLLRLDHSEKEGSIMADTLNPSTTGALGSIQIQSAVSSLCGDSAVRMAVPFRNPYSRVTLRSQPICGNGMYGEEELIERQEFEPRDKAPFCRDLNNKRQSKDNTGLQVPFPAAGHKGPESECGCIGDLSSVIKVTDAEKSTSPVSTGSSSTGSSTPKRPRSNVSAAPLCGNGRLDPGEVCELGQKVACLCNFSGIHMVPCSNCAAPFCNHELGE